ncbi:Aluminum-activated malate transporter 8 [Linum perenne]
MEIDSAASATHQEQQNPGLFGRVWSTIKDKLITVSKGAMKIGKDDPRRIIHSLKVGLSLTLVSLLYYIRPLYDGFGVAGMWAVLTVVVISEFTVGGTLSKGLNRGFATLFAGALGVGAQHLAALSGHKGEPVVLGILVFLLASTSTFMRFFPKIKARYDYGVLIFILTFALVTVSGYRVDELLTLAEQRVVTIIIGGATCMVVSICICPVWAGEDLHKLVSSNIDKLGCYLEGIYIYINDEKTRFTYMASNSFCFTTGFAGEYFQSPEDGEITADAVKSIPLLYKSVLTSKSTEDILANLARWEPRHGQFRLKHPWKQYLKTAAAARHCAYQIEALNGYIYSGIQAPKEFQNKIKESCTRMSEESGMALRSLASSMKSMTDPSPANVHVENSKAAMKDLKVALKAVSVDQADFLEIVPVATVASILVETVKSVEKLTESVHELANLAHFKSLKATVSPEKQAQLLHRGSIKPVLDGDDADHVVITVLESPVESSETVKSHHQPANGGAGKTSEVK